MGSSKLDIGSDDGIPGNCENQEDDGFYDDFEDKLLEAIEGTSEKSVKTRQMCLEAIKKAFTKRYCVDFIVERYNIALIVMRKLIFHLIGKLL